MSTRRSYSDDERAAVLAAVTANGGDCEETAGQFGLPARTVRAWASGERHPEARAMSEAVRQPLADRLEEVARRITDAIDDPDRLREATLKDLTAALDTVIEKHRLLRGEPTSIQQQAVGVSLGDLSYDELLAIDRLLSAAEGRAALPPGPGPGRDGPEEPGRVRPAGVAGPEPGP